MPKRPNQSSRGPPCGDSQEQPRKWCTSPSPGPESTCNPPQRSDPKALKGHQGPPSFSPRNLHSSWRREGSWTFRGGPGGEASPKGPRRVKLPRDPFSSRSHPAIAQTSSLSWNVSRPCDYLAKFPFYRTMTTSVSFQESDQDSVQWETSGHICLANTDSKLHPRGDPGPITAQDPMQASVESANQLRDKLRVSEGRERANGASSPRQQNSWVDREGSHPSLSPPLPDNIWAWAGASPSSSGWKPQPGRA